MRKESNGEGKREIRTHRESAKGRRDIHRLSKGRSGLVGVPTAATLLENTERNSRRKHTGQARDRQS